MILISVFINVSVNVLWHLLYHKFLWERVIYLFCCPSAVSYIHNTVTYILPYKYTLPAFKDLYLCFLDSSICFTLLTLRPFLLLMLRYDIFRCLGFSNLMTSIKLLCVILWGRNMRPRRKMCDD